MVGLLGTEFLECIEICAVSPHCSSSTEIIAGRLRTLRHYWEWIWSCRQNAGSLAAAGEVRIMQMCLARMHSVTQHRDHLPSVITHRRLLYSSSLKFTTLISMLEGRGNANGICEVTEPLCRECCFHVSCCIHKPANHTGTRDLTGKHIFSRQLHLPSLGFLHWSSAKIKVTIQTEGCFVSFFFAAVSYCQIFWVTRSTAGYFGNKIQQTNASLAWETGTNSTFVSGNMLYNDLNSNKSIKVCIHAYTKSLHSSSVSFLNIQ